LDAWKILNYIPIRLPLIQYRALVQVVMIFLQVSIIEVKKIWQCLNEFEALFSCGYSGVRIYAGNLVDSMTIKATTCLLMLHAGGQMLVWTNYYYLLIVIS
ncbi:hypothetical protein KAR91_85720, partial [Candidatus Pacearchaeota archaeon]|nr:hypothetical protein [Candidatus Pacearchaeota archaeon]